MGPKIYLFLFEIVLHFKTSIGEFMKKLVILVCLAVLCYPSLVTADEAKVGFVKNVSGQAFIGRQNILIPAKVKEKLLVNDTLITKTNGSMGVIFQDNSVLSLGPNSRFILTQFSFEPSVEKLSFVAKIRKGTLIYLTGLIGKLNHKGVRFETPNAVCGIRGTHFAIKVDARDDDTDIEPATSDQKSPLLSIVDKNRGKQAGD